MVVGTVIDPDMTEELKVTVVATGLGSEAQGTNLKVVGSPQRAPEPEPVEPAADVTPTQRRPSPEVQRELEATTPRQAAVGQDMDIFDVPAFLRRQAD